MFICAPMVMSASTQCEKPFLTARISGVRPSESVALTSVSVTVVFAELMKTSIVPWNAAAWYLLELPSPISAAASAPMVLPTAYFVGSGGASACSVGVGGGGGFPPPPLYLRPRFSPRYFLACRRHSPVSPRCLVNLSALEAVRSLFHNKANDTLVRRCSTDYGP